MGIVARPDVNPEQKTATDPVLDALKLLVGDIESGLIGVQLDGCADWNERLKTFAAHFVSAQVAVAQAEIR
jgi:hypothetical protein